MPAAEVQGATRSLEAADRGGGPGGCGAVVETEITEGEVPRRGLRRAAWSLLVGGAIAAIAGLALLVAQPPLPLPWGSGDDADPVRGGTVVGDVDPREVVGGVVLLVAVAPEAEVDEVLSALDDDPERVDGDPGGGLVTLVFADDAARLAAAERLDGHPAVRLLHRPDDLGLDARPAGETGGAR